MSDNIERNAELVRLRDEGWSWSALTERYGFAAKSSAARKIYQRHDQMVQNRAAREERKAERARKLAEKDTFDLEAYRR